MNKSIEIQKKRSKHILIYVIFFLLFSLFSYSHASASTYYVSSTGSDSNNGTSTSTPWQTLSKVNSSTFIPGDSILFKKGDTFYGTLQLHYMFGSSGNQIVYGSYGTGSQPIITGFTTISGWINEGGGIYSKVITSESQTNMVTIDGVQYGMGRYPNSTDLTYESFSSNTSITDSQLTGTPNWSGAEVVIKKNDYTIDRNTITNHTGSTLTYTSLGTTLNATANFPYFIQNDLRTLDTFGEWYHNTSTGKFYMYFGGVDPNTKVVKVATVDNLLNAGSGEDYTTIDGINFIGSIKEAVNIHWQNDNFIVQNCNINFAGLSGIYLAGSNGIIRNNSISYANGSGILSFLTSGDINNNSISNTSLIEGQGGIGSFNNVAISIYYNNVNTYNNTIGTVGGFGVMLSSNVTIGTIDNNYISNTCINISDCGSVYLAGSHPSVVIDGNIIIRSGGNGIYLDEYSNNIIVRNNSVSGASLSGIKLHKAHDNTVSNNILFDNGTGFDFENWLNENNLYNNTVSGNISVAKSATQYSLFFITRYTNNNFGTSTGNYYARPIADTNTIYTDLSSGNQYRTLSNWQSYSSQDANSKKSPVAVSSESDIFFDYNATTSNKTSTLPWPAVDMDGVKHTGNVTILPYSSVIYLKDQNPASSDTTAPTISSFTIPTTSSSLTVPISTFTATDTVGVTGYLLTETSATPSAASGSWSSTVPTSYVFSTEGSKTLYAWAKDAASNVSTSVSDTVTITLPPVTATTFTLTGPSSGNINTASTSFTITPNNTYTGTITITPSGTASTGLSAITKTFSSSSVAQTFTITPTVAGSITLSPSNNGGLTNPANLTYTVTSGTRTTPTTFYVSNTGSDSNNGTSTSTPWQTLAKVNASTFIPGDSILFKKGDTFYGSITVSQSGTSGNPITFSSYGTGNQPIITGFTTISGWTNEGNGIYSKVITSESQTNMVTVDDVQKGMGRYPNVGNLLHIDSFSGTTSITDSEVPASANNWTGAELVIRSATPGSYNRWIRNPITNHAGNTLTFSGGDSTYPNGVGMGYFIQNDLRTLDTFGEWYHNTSTGKFYMYFGGVDPNTKVVKVSSIDQLIHVEEALYNSEVGYIIFNGINFTGSNKNSIYARITRFITIENCNFDFSGGYAISGSRAYDIQLLNNTFNHTNDSAILVGTYSDGSQIDGNTINNTGLVLGVGESSWYSGKALVAVQATNVNSAVNVIIQNNKIYNSGSGGINFAGNNLVVRHNLVDTFGLNRSDCGGIQYGYQADYTNMSVLDNIILNGYTTTELEGMPVGVSSSGVSGIYLDYYSTGGFILNNNTVANVPWGGIIIHGTQNVEIKNNTLFNNGEGIYFQELDGLGSPTRNVTMNGNVFIAKTPTQVVLWGRSMTNDFSQWGTFTNNYYARPIDDTNTFATLVATWTNTYRTLSNWQSYSSQDANSKKSPVAVSSESDIFFDYNATTSNKTSTLPWPAVDMDGVKHTGNVTILPYSSVIYLKDPNPASSDTTAPTISSFTIPTTSSSLTVPISTLSATDATGVTGYLLTETSATPSAASGSWSSTVPTSYVFSTEGSKTLYAWAKDAAGNVSTSVSDTVTITLPPVTATTFTLTGPSSGNINTASTNFTITPNNTYTGTITITPSGTASTGLSAITKTFSSSSVAQTFTITPTVAGSITLSPSNNGGLTNPANLTYTSNAVVPGAPTSVSAVAGNASATVSFLAPSSNGGSTITGYTVTSSPAGGTDTNAGSTSLSHSITGLTNGTSYTFTVKATNAIGQSVASAASSAVTPQTPTATTFTLTGPSSGNINTASTNFTITPNNTYTGTITITPSGTASTGLSTITKTFSSSSVAQTFTITPTVAGSITLSPSNNGGLTNPANLTYTSNAVVPGAPTSVSAVAGNASATVSFLAPSSNGGSTITGYTVTSSPAGGTDTNAGSTSLSHSITGLTNGTSYTFTVKATNAIGQSVASAASSAVTPQTNTFTLTINKSGTGSGTVTGGGTYNSGTSVTAGATPSTGSTFTSWSGDCNTSGQVTMTANKVCTATFTLNTYSIVSSTGTNGNISPLGTTSKNYATNQTYTITPSTGYHIVSVLVDGVSQGAISTYTFTNVTANHTISATFDIDVINGTISNVSATATSTSSITANWTTSVSSDSQVEYGLTTSYGSTTSVNTNLTTSHSISIPNLKRNTTYHYRVKSVDATSNILQSTDQIIKTLSQLTKTPKVRTLTASNGSVNLSWLAPLDPDGNTYELYSGVIIMRSTTSFIQSVDTATAIADIKSPTMTYHDTDVVNGTTYYYTFFAYDNLGVYSDPEFISFTPTQAVSSGGGGGGGGGSSSSSTTTTTTSTLSAKAKAKDIKQDGSINIFDFNIIMANWNQTYSTTTSLSKGDMTGDGIINIFDINQLMIYWGVGY